MKKIAVMLLAAVMTLSFTAVVFGVDYADMLSGKKPLVLCSFDDKKMMNAVAGQMGVFDGDPQDSEAYCRAGFEQDSDLHKAGFVMKLSYDVNSSKPAFNGLWMKLNGMDFSKFKAISFNIKGDKEKGFSDLFKIELKDKTKKMEYIVEDIKDSWKNYVIPFADFDGDQIDLTKGNEFVIVFEDWRLKTKEGRYYIDDITFIPKDGSTTTTTTTTTDTKKDDKAVTDDKKIKLKK
jgi:hypothetical protein